MFRKSFQIFTTFFLQNLNLRNALGFSISGILLWLTIYTSGMSWRDLNIDLSGIGWFLLADIFFVLSVWLYAVRTKLYWITDVRKPRHIYAFSSIAIGNFYNSILPGNLGEGMRAWHFGRRNKIPFLQSISSLLAEKWIDAQYFVVLTVGLFIARPFLPDYVSYAILYTACAIFALFILYMVMRLYHPVERALLSLVLLFQKPGRIVYTLYWYTTFLIKDLFRKKYMLRYILLCCGIYALNACQFFFLMRAAGIDGRIAGLYTSYLVSLSMMIIAFIPSAPGNIGVLHYGVYSVLIFAASQDGLQPSAGMLHSFARFGIYVHLSYLIPETVMGIICIFKEKDLIFSTLYSTGSMISQDKA